MTIPLHGTPDGATLRHEPGAPVSIVQAAPVPTAQTVMAGMASLGISAAGAVVAVDLIAHSATGYALITVLACATGAAEVVRRGLGWGGSDDDDEPPQPRAEIERDKILDMVKWGHITAEEGERLLAVLQPPATGISADGS